VGEPRLLLFLLCEKVEAASGPLILVLRGRVEVLEVIVVQVEVEWILSLFCLVLDSFLVFSLHPFLSEKLIEFVAILGIDVVVWDLRLDVPLLLKWAAGLFGEVAISVPPRVVVLFDTRHDVILQDLIEVLDLRYRVLDLCYRIPRPVGSKGVKRG